MTKPKKRIAVLVQTVAVLAVLVTLSLCFAGCNGDPIENITPVEFNHDDLGVAPGEAALEGTDRIDQSKILATSAEKTSDEDVKATAAYLFNLANNNLGKVDWYANKATGDGTATIDMGAKASGDMEVREIRIKDGDAMYMETMGQVVDGRMNNGSSADWIISLCRGILDYGNRKYTPDGETFYLQSGGTGVLNESSLDNFYTDEPYIDWSKCDKVETVSTEQFMEQEYYRNHYAETNSSIIEARTLTEASVTHNDDYGFYEIVMVVDVTTDALDLATASTRKSASSDDIVFVYQTITCQVWDCGLFRTYVTDDSWAGTLAGALGGSSVNHWEKYFTYNKENAPGMQIPEGMDWYL